MSFVVLAFIAGFCLRHGLAYLFEAKTQRVTYRRK